ncbi:hypothetical protein NC651_010919 [Populus alba x Populus x berolinensis]|nr:hypothetical protein NC651_010919 [Populus alba x Populus x berolinensis]
MRDQFSLPHDLIQKRRRRSRVSYACVTMHPQ